MNNINIMPAAPDLPEKSKEVLKEEAIKRVLDLVEEAQKNLSTAKSGSGPVEGHKEDLRGASQALFEAIALLEELLREETNEQE